MKNPSFPRLALALFVAGLFCVPARSADSARVGAYDFSYYLSGDALAKPVQVFDDGRNTYFQFRAGEAVPAIFAARSGTLQLVVPTQEGPYVRVPEVHGRFVLQVGSAQANVIHGSGSRADAPQIAAVAHNGMSTLFTGQGSLPAGGRLLASLAPVAVAMGDEQALDRNSYATPIKGDRVEWTPPPETPVETAVPFVAGVAKPGPRATRLIRSLAQAVSGANRIEITGRDDGTYKEGLAEARANAIADMLAAGGIPRARLVIKASHGSAGTSAKGVVTGASIAAFAEKPRAEPTLATRGGKAAVEDIVARLRAGELSPFDAAKALASARSAAEPGKAVVEPAVVFERSPTAKWQVRASDGTVETMLRRWGQDSGWRVISKGAPEIRIKGDAEFERPDFLQAADYAITQAKQAGYPIEARAYSNKVLVIQTKD